MKTRETTPYLLTFCDANGRRKDRPNGGLYITEDADAAPTLSTSHNEGLVIVENHDKQSDICGVSEPEAGGAADTGGDHLADHGGVFLDKAIHA